MRRSILPLSKKQVKKIIRISLYATTIILGVFVIYFASFTGKIYPNTKIAGIEVGGLTVADAANHLSKTLSITQKIQLSESGQSFNIDTTDFDLSYDSTGSAERAFSLTRTGNVFYDIWERVATLFKPKNIGLKVNLNEEKLAKIISVISGQISVEPVEPSIKLAGGVITIDKGTPGTNVDSQSLRILIGESLSLIKTDNIQIPIISVDHTLNQFQADELKRRAEKYIGKSIQLKFEFSSYTLTDKDLIKFLDTGIGYNNQSVEALVPIYSAKVERDPQNPKFNFVNGKVTEFLPALDGIRMDGDALKNQIILSLNKIENGVDKTITFDVPVLRTPPEVSTGSVNNLGIKELIGRGTSTYFHSIPGRIHNVVLAASRINGTLVKPGDTFSFNDTLGDVSTFTGYQQAYIISEGKTILGDGGGVCQVSTTLFRAILNAGLPVTERAAHAYRVGYYEQDSLPGFDATVYGPSPDLKFKNDTANYILIEATASPKNYSLVFELYGTSDGRVATVSKPIVTNIMPSLPTIYQDDPTLPAGTLKQTDYSAAGATVKFNYTVKRAGVVIYQKTFTSNYRPWAAVYLRGTGSAI